MAFDRYRARLRHAKWTWREDKYLPSNSRRMAFLKDRASGRAEKRAARQQDRREFETEAANDL